MYSSLSSSIKTNDYSMHVDLCASTVCNLCSTLKGKDGIFLSNK